MKGIDGKMEKMLTKAAALQLLFSRWDAPVRTEVIPTAEASGRVPVREYTAQYDIPVFRASMMDGIAVRSADFQAPLHTQLWRRGEDYIRADTGDDFDDRFDAVIPIEAVTFQPDGGVLLRWDKPVTPGLNVRGCGSTLRAGTTVAVPGLPLRGTDLAALEMGGHTQVEVYVRPRVAFLPTGSELIPPGAPLRRGCNFDTNSLMAKCMLEEMGAVPVCLPIVPDDPEKLRTALTEALRRADLVVINGGTSKGDEDYGTRLLAREGELLLHGAAAGPGRPIGIALVQGKPVINLSGPAIGAFYGLDWCVRPIVCRFLHLPVPRRERVRGVLTRDMRCAPPMEFLCRVEVRRQGDSCTVTPLNRGQADLPSILRSNAMFLSPIGESIYPAGTSVEVELLRDMSLLPEESGEAKMN